ncbi:Oidioi.mRNA.OKI2018_I69.chr2.g4380.t1.cds [Oikopleura dioica]|uniref:Oidioi.mRNA.OKI2018_I69.chr2.g4380.t1.cds n=1 Tax=Oikopleura dioica TaxID=34765 RepID=A0ABN7T1F3_OIKDI|nr:Oidioi.mRNA.OKI2018_I69.chr2.g4380.t1.cds [Oikopleura dioica]
MKKFLMIGLILVFGGLCYAGGYLHAFSQFNNKELQQNDDFYYNFDFDNFNKNYDGDQEGLVTYRHNIIN